MKKLMTVCIALAIITGLVYFLTGAGVLTVPGLDANAAPAAIPYIAGGCYILGGLLILTRKTGLWITGAIINLLVIFIFFMAYNQKPDIMYSIPGLTTKITQLLLEVGLISLIIMKSIQRTRTQPAY